jgi:hypothetical protein
MMATRPSCLEAVVEAPRTNRQVPLTRQSKIEIHSTAFTILLSKVFLEQSTPCPTPIRSSIQIAESRAMSKAVDLDY